MGGSSKTAVTTTTNQPAAYAAPHLQNIATQAENLYNSGQGFNYYPGSTVVPFSAQTNTALQGMENLANQGDPLARTNLTAAQGILGNGGLNATQNAAIKNLMGTANQAPGSNPYFLQALDDQMARTAANTNMGFSLSGRYGSGAHADTLSRNIGQARTAALSNQYNTDVTNSLNAAQAAANIGQQGQANMATMSALAPQISQSQYAPYQMLNQVGSAQEDLAQRQLQDQVARYQQQQQQPLQQLQAYADMINGVSRGYGTSTNVAPVQKPSAAQGILGGAAAGGALLGPIGALGGGILGGLF